MGAFPAVPGLSWTERIPDSRISHIVRSRAGERTINTSSSFYSLVEPQSGVLDVIRSAWDNLPEDAATPEQTADFCIITTNDPQHETS